MTIFDKTDLAGTPLMARLGEKLQKSFDNIPTFVENPHWSIDDEDYF